MDTGKIGIRYAKALFMLAEQKGLLDITRKDVEYVFSSFREVKEINLFLENPVIQESKKQEIIKTIFQGKVQDMVIQFLRLVIKNNREMHVESICRDFIALYKEYKGIKSVVLTTAIPLNTEMKQPIYETIKKQLGTEIEINEKVNENILGGFLIQIDDQLIDASISGKLNQLERQLVKSK